MPRGDKWNHGGRRVSTRPDAKKAGRPKAFATVRIPIDAARAVLPWLEEARRICINPEAERGLSFLIAGLWSELTARPADTSDKKEEPR